MREPDPDRVLERITARQFAEWWAYERAFGSIGGIYEREMLAELNELLQLNNQLTGAAITKKGKKNPAGKFRNVPRPWSPDAEDRGSDEAEDDEYEDEYRVDDQATHIAKFDREVFESGKYEVEKTE